MADYTLLEVIIQSCLNVSNCFVNYGNITLLQDVGNKSKCRVPYLKIWPLTRLA